MKTNKKSIKAPKLSKFEKQVLKDVNKAHEIELLAL